MKIINLTQHNASPEQVAEGVFEPKNKEAVKSLLTFLKAPKTPEILARAEALAGIAEDDLLEGVTSPNDGEAMEPAPSLGAMVGGASYLTSSLERALRARGIEPLHSFSVRQSTETVLPDGSTKKELIFRHGSFVEVP